MGIDATNWAWRAPVESAAQRLVLLSLADRANEDHCCFPSMMRVEKDTCLNIKTVKAVISRLIEMGLIADTGDRVGSTSRVRVLKLIGIESREMNPKTESFQKRNEPKNGTLNEPKNGTLNEPKNGSQNHPVKRPCNHPDKKINAGANGREEQQQKIDSLTSPYKPKSGSFLIDFDWQPTQAFKIECMRAGKDCAGITKDMLGQFINHYRTKGHVKDQRAYEGLLLSWLMRELAKPKPSTSTPRAYSRNQYHDPILDNPDAKMQPDHIMGQDNEAVKNRVPPADFKNKMANLKNLLEQ